MYWVTRHHWLLASEDMFVYFLGMFLWVFVIFWVMGLTAGWRVSAAGTLCDPVQVLVLSAGSSLSPDCCLHKQKDTPQYLYLRGFPVTLWFDRWVGIVPVSGCVLKGTSAARLGAEFPSRSGRDEETAGSDGFLLHFNTSGYSSWQRQERKRWST